MTAMVTSRIEWQTDTVGAQSGVAAVHRVGWQRSPEWQRCSTAICSHRHKATHQGTHSPVCFLLTCYPLVRIPLWGRGSTCTLTCVYQHARSRQAGYACRGGRGLGEYKGQRSLLVPLSWHVDQSCAAATADRAQSPDPPPPPNPLSAYISAG